MSVATARTAYARGEWRTVVTELEREPVELDTDDLLLLAEAHWWLGDSPASMAVSEAAFERLAARPGGEAAAADRALRLTLQWFVRGDLQVGAAWLARARRLLAGIPESPLHGWLEYFAAAGDLSLTGDPTSCEVAAGRVDELAARFDDPTLRCFALALRGLAAIRRGGTPDGFALLDEALLPVLAGRVEPLWAGDLYCTVIHLCDDLGDLARMRAWTEGMARWAGPLSATFMFAGVTRVHELQLLAAAGDWDAVEAELGAQSDDLVGAHGWLAGEGYYTLGEVRRLRGDAAGARAAYARARELAHEAQPGEALLLLAEGRAPEALAGLRVALSEADRLRRARQLLPGVRIALACQETSYAEVLADELDGTARWFGTPGLRAQAAWARAELLLASGSPAAALPLLEEAAAVYREQRYRHASAQVRERMAAARHGLGEPGAAAAELATATAIYTDLGAVPDLRRLAGRDQPGGLTSREVEVLRVVARGGSNREVAETLSISGKTVSRHLTNIFLKLGVSTRTAAAAWAREHGV